MAFNFSGLFLFLLAKNRASQQPGVSPQDATRRALPVLFINPPILGLLATSTLTQNQPVVAASNSAGKALAAAGHSLLSAAGVELPQKFFPSFIGLSLRHAHESAESCGLTPKNDRSTPPNQLTHPIVMSQKPAQDVKWEDDMDTVTFTYKSK
jgi:hypothetical protein